MTQLTPNQTVTTQRILGLDIGGANVKLADSDGHYVRSVPFPMWSQYAALQDTIRNLLDTYQTEQGRFEALAVTMTGELADCFTSKQQGVLYIAQAASAAAAAANDAARVFFYETGGEWSDAEVIPTRWNKLAASNWYAMAQYSCQILPRGTHLLIDIGSTTADIIPIVDGAIVTNAVDDTSRLQQAQLVYCGVERTSLCSLTSELSIDGVQTPIAREHFATTLDVFLLTDEIPERPTCNDTADGEAAIKSAAHRRMARMICQCPELLTTTQSRQMALDIRATMIGLLTHALQRVTTDLGKTVDSVIAVGQGDFLLPDIVGDKTSIQWLSDLHPEGCDGLARIGPAFAVATLLHQHLSQA